MDLACGTGLVTFPAAEAVGPDGEVVATDISEAMTAEVSRLAQERGHRQVTARRMDAEELDFPDASFDVALCGLGLMYVPDPKASLTETRRVLKARGRAAMAVWGARDNCGWAEIFPIVDRRVNTEVCPLFFQLGNGDALKYVMDLAGFEEIRLERISTVLEYETSEDALGAAFLGGPVALAYSRFDHKTRAEVHQEYLDSIEPFKNGDGYRIPGEFVVAVGITD